MEYKFEIGDQVKIIKRGDGCGLGVVGEMSGSEGMKPQAKAITPSNTEQTILPDKGYNCLSQVTVAKIPYVESENAAGGTTVTIG